MEFISRTFYLLILSELFIGFLTNLVLKNFPRIPGDIYFDRPGIRLYIPFTSAIALSIIISVLLKYFQR